MSGGGIVCGATFRNCLRSTGDAIGTSACEEFGSSYGHLTTMPCNYVPCIWEHVDLIPGY